MRPHKNSQTTLRNPMLALGLVLVFVIYMVRLMGDLKQKEARLPEGVAITASASTPIPGLTREATQTEPAFSVYFTNPKNTASRQVENALIAALDGAQKSIDIAMYNLSLDSIPDSLIRAAAREVDLRLVMESDNLDQDAVQRLKSAGIPVLGDRRESLMHNKFVVIDALQVWTGSLNLTENGIYEDNNNLLEIRSPTLAENYSSEFEEMFLDDMFGNNSPADTPYPFLTIDGSYVEAYFSPEDRAAEHLVSLIESARESVHFLLFSFTSNPLAKAILNRAAAGMEVQGVLDADQVESNLGGEYERLKTAGIDVRLDVNAGQMHHKVLIIDGKVVVTGSYNFSTNAETNNDENILIIHNPQLAAEYEKEFQKVFTEAKKE